MPLSAMPADPEPTDEELEPYLSKTRLLPEAEARWPGVGRRFAALLWRVDKGEENPDLFLIPFADAVDDYPGYMVSDQWKAVRKEALVLSSWKCRCCDRPAREVHHRDYRPRVLEGKDLNALVPLCVPHHEQIEKVRKGESWNKAERLLAELILQHERRSQTPP